MTIFLTSVIGGVAACLMGQMTGLWPLLAAAFVNGSTLGAFECGCQVFIMQVMKEESMPFVQLVYFMFGIGSLASPLIAEPFLLFDPNSDNVFDNKSFTEDEEQELRVWIPYAIAGGIQVTAGLAVLLVRLMTGKVAEAAETPADPESSSSEESKKGVASHGESLKFWKRIVIILHLIIVHVYFGLEIVFGSFLVVFAVNSPLHLSKSTGSFLTAVFWISFTFGKLPALFYIPRLGVGRSILFGFAITVIGNVVLVPFGSDNELMLWIGVTIVGFGLSSIYVCLLRYLQSFFRVTSVVSSLSTLISLLGEFTIPLIVSAFVESDPQVVLWCVLISTIVMVTLFPILMLICNQKLAKQE